MSSIRFPPLMSGIEAGAHADPFHEACARAARGCDPGLVVYRITADRLSAAIVFTPEMPLCDAAALLPVCGIGFQNALGALAPPEIAVHLDWDGGIRLNGASCGRLCIAAPTRNPAAEPDWMVVGLALRLKLGGENPGDSPDKTALFEEGCSEVEPARLLESWSKHTLVWINRWEDDGIEPLRATWRALAFGIDEDIEVLGRRGKFTGIDGKFGMLFATGGTTEVLPLTNLLSEPT